MGGVDEVGVPTTSNVGLVRLETTAANASPLSCRDNRKLAGALEAAQQGTAAAAETARREEREAAQQQLQAAVEEERRRHR